jgi:hypothetical protein
VEDLAKAVFQQELSKACAAHVALDPASLVLYDVSTLHFETDAGDGFREPCSAIPACLPVIRCTAARAFKYDTSRKRCLRD